MAAPGSTAFEAYNQGVKMGCWGLVCSSIVSAISAGILIIFFILKSGTFNFI